MGIHTKGETFNWEKLLSSSREACLHSYSPYSSFPVGAAVLASNGQIFKGCNIENASYGLTICAERVAIFSAIASGSQQIQKLAVSCLKGDPNQPKTLMPCGACLQVMSEFFHKDAEILVDGVGCFKISTLFPLPFTL